MTSPTDPPDIPSEDEQLAPVETRLGSWLEVESVPAEVVEAHLATAMGAFDELHSPQRAARRRWLPAAAAIVLVVAGVSAVIASSSSSKDATVASGATQSKVLAPASGNAASRSASADPGADSRAGSGATQSANQYGTAGEAPAAPNETKSAAAMAPAASADSAGSPQLGSFDTVDQLIAGISADRRAASLVPEASIPCASTQETSARVVGVAIVGNRPVIVYSTPGKDTLHILSSSDCRPLR